MEFRTKCLLFILLSSTPLLTAAHNTHVYKFGTPNLPGTVLVAHTKGTMAHFDHTKRIQLYVPPCYMPTYVQVEVTNYLATPDVQYNSRSRSVTIHYKTWQSSKSSYNILVQGALVVGCGVQKPRDTWMKHRRDGSDSNENDTDKITNE